MWKGGWKYKEGRMEGGVCESGREGRKDGGREECVRVGEKVGRMEGGKSV